MEGRVRGGKEERLWRRWELCGEQDQGLGLSSFNTDTSEKLIFQLHLELVKMFFS